MMQPELRAFAADGLHDDLLEAIVSRVPQGATVLDLGAGQGALSLRLKNAGYDVIAVDWLQENFRVQGVPFIKADLDRYESVVSIAARQQFDAVVACEVIEHLRHPWRLVEACAELLPVGGKLFVSTPNTACASSRINMLVNGTPNSFGANRKTIGHISPLLPTQLHDMFESVNMDNIEVLGVGRPQLIREATLRGTLQSCLMGALRPLMQSTLRGPCMLAVGTKSCASASVSHAPTGVGDLGAYQTDVA